VGIAPPQLIKAQWGQSLLRWDALTWLPHRATHGGCLLEYRPDLRWDAFVGAGREDAEKHGILANLHGVRTGQVGVDLIAEASPEKWCQVRVLRLTPGAAGVAGGLTGLGTVGRAAGWLWGLSGAGSWGRLGLRAWHDEGLKGVNNR